MMNVAEVLHMNGGNGLTSYANNSLLQRNVIHMTKPITQQAMTSIYTSLDNPKTISIADLGCSSGPNTFLAISNLVKAVDDHRKKLRRPHSPEFQIYLNDLPTNDFNTIFQSLPKHRREIAGDGSGLCFFNGVPGSFYGRLFPTDSLHFVHSSYSLNWLSQGLVEEEKLNSFNFPLYLPTLPEIKSVVEKDGSFTIDCLHASQIHWTGIGIEDNDDNITVSDEDINGAGNNVAMFMRAGLEPVLVSHFGVGIIDELFHRYSNKIAHSMSTYPEKAKVTSVTVSMTKI